MITIIKDIQNNLNALRIQFFVTIKTTVATTRLGALWWILDPLMLMLIYTFVVKIIFNRGGPNYHLFALCGIVTWQCFSRSVTLCSTALLRNAQLIKQSNLPMHLYILLPTFVQAFFCAIGLAIVAVWNYNAIGLQTFCIIPMFIPLIIIPYTAGLFLSILTVKIPDIDKVIPYILRFAFYMSPILYSPERVYNLPNVDPFLKQLYALNPMVHIISAVRDVLLNGHIFDIKKFLIITGSTLIFTKIGIIYFRYFMKTVPKEL